MRSEIAWWLEASERDREMAISLAREGLYEGAAFHLQQSAGKALKALLLRSGRETRTHSCVQMEKMLGSAGIDTSGIAGDCKKLDGHYIMSRYPIGVGGPPKDYYSEDIIEGLRACQERIAEFVRRHL
ncbi:MAG: HEPN domain-containing protein [Actinobacteria bacterium]|nr:HEPN domain-containing protein [Actinomycetota bacterium]